MANTLQANQIADAIVTTPGSEQEIFKQNVTGGIQTLSSATWVNVPNLAEQTFVIAFNGQYRITASPTLLGGTVLDQFHSRFRLIFDESNYNGFTEQTIGVDDEEWSLRCRRGENVGNVDDFRGYMAALVDLPPGTHKVKFQYKTISTNPPRVRDTNPFIIRAMAITGSGAGGEIIEDAAPNGTAVSITGTGTGNQQTIVTDTIDINANDAVQVNFVGYCKKTDNENTAILNVRLYADGSPLTPDPMLVIKPDQYGTAARDSISFSKRVTGLSAGTRTLSIRAYTTSSTGTGTYDVHPTAFQLSIARGGLVPVESEGVAVLDTPRAINYGSGFSVTDSSGKAAITLQDDWRYHDVTDLPTSAAALEACWQFDGSVNELDDLTANGHDLTASASMLHTASGGLQGILSVDTFYLTAAADAGLRTTGAFTFSALTAIEDTSNVCVLATCNASGETEVANILYDITIRLERYVRLVHEYSTGSDESLNTDAAPPLHTLHHLTVTRSSDGLTYSVYIDGQLIDSVVATNAPTGGSTTEFSLLGAATFGAFYRGALFSALFTKEEWSAAQVLESYKYCRKLL